MLHSGRGRSPSHGLAHRPSACCHAMGTFDAEHGAKPDPNKYASGDRRGQGWATSSTFVTHVKKWNAHVTTNGRRQTACASAKARPGTVLNRRATRKPVTTSTNTRSKRETSDEIAGS